MQITRARGEAGLASTIVVRLGLAIFFTMNVMMVSMPSYVPYVYANEPFPTDGPLFQVLRVLALAFAAPVLLLLGWPIVKGAGEGIRRGSANTDSLIVLGVAAAYLLSVFHTLRGEGAVYFDTAAMLLVLVTLGRYLEATAKAAAGSAIDATLTPTPLVATRIRGTLEPVDPANLLIGDFVRVTPGELFPTDGIIVEGEGGVDEATLTGENTPVLKSIGATVAGGTGSIDGVFRVLVTATASDSATARIAAMLAQARRERAPSERFADRVSSVLVPLVLMTTVAAGTYWYAAAGIEQAILVGLSILVVACPCGLGIATPVAVWTGLATASRRGVIIRSAPIFERLAEVGHVWFDKTGTLTQRTPRLTRVEALGQDSDARLLVLAASLERGLLHPLARALVAIADERQLDFPTAEDVEVIPGLGVRGTVEGRSITIGSSTLLRRELPTARPNNRDGVFVWDHRGLIGHFEFDEVVRPEAAAAIASTRDLSLSVGVLSGDRSGKALVPHLFSPAEAHFGLLPEGKVARARATARGDATAMVGDGINDAPALAAATVGVAVGSATDLARMTADVTIIHDDLRRVPWLLGYAQRVQRVIRQNLLWAFAYNAGAVVAAAFGALNPLIASLAMLGSSLVVVANARRLRRTS